MNLSLLLQWWGFAGGDFLKTLAYFLPVHSAKKPCNLEECGVENSHKMGLHKVSRPSVWLTQCSQQSKDMPSSPAASVSWKKGKLTGVLHADKLTWEAGDLFSLHATLGLQGERDRSAGSRRWEPRELAGVQHGVRLGPHFQKGHNPGKEDFISF